MDHKIRLVRKWAPVEFTRKPRTLADAERYKASEFRTLLLYTGVYIFKGILADEMYDHFLILMCAIRFLSYKDNLENEVTMKMVDKLCLSFSANYSKIYKNASVVLNVHNLIHLPDTSIYPFVCPSVCLSVRISVSIFCSG